MSFGLGQHQEELTDPASSLYQPIESALRSRLSAPGPHADGTPTYRPTTSTAKFLSVPHYSFHSILWCATLGPQEEWRNEVPVRSNGNGYSVNRFCLADSDIATAAGCLMRRSTVIA